MPSRAEREGPSRPAKWLGLPPRVAVGFAVAVVSVCVAAACSFAALSARTQAGDAVRHTAAVRLAVEELESSILVSDARLDAALAHGGGVAGFVDARRRLRPALAALRTASAGDPDEEQLVERVIPEVEALDAGQKRALALARSGDNVRAQATYRADVRPAIDRAHAVLGALEELEEGEAVVRAAQHVRVVRTSNALSIAADAVLLALVLFAARLVGAEIRRRERYEAELTRAMDVRQRLVAVVSHDLRNPLSAIIGSAWSLDRLALPEEGRRAARRISSAARRMSRLIRDLLDWSRAHAGVDVPIVPRDTDLCALCARVADDVAGGSDRVTVAAEGDPHALVDPDRIEQVVANLVSNALRHGDPERPVRVTVEGDTADVRIEVRDDGPGIAPDVRTTLFEPFHTARPVLHGPGDAGVGLGLFVVRLLTEAHGGRVRVDSAPGSGTAFVVTLPRAPAAAPVS